MDAGLGLVMNERDHWESVYRSKTATEVSWFRLKLERSLELIALCELPADGRRCGRLVSPRRRASLPVGNVASVSADGVFADELVTSYVFTPVITRWRLWASIEAEPSRVFTSP